MNLARDVIDWLLFGIKWISNTKKKLRGAFNSHGFINKQKHVGDNATPISLSSHLSSCFSLLLSHPNIKKKLWQLYLSLSLFLFHFTVQFNVQNAISSCVCVCVLFTWPHLENLRKNKLIHVDYVNITFTYRL